MRLEPIRLAPFHNRCHAAEELVELVRIYRRCPNTVVVSLDSTSIPVALQLARYLELPCRTLQSSLTNRINEKRTGLSSSLNYDYRTDHDYINRIVGDISFSVPIAYRMASSSTIGTGVPEIEDALPDIVTGVRVLLACTGTEESSQILSGLNLVREWNPSLIMLTAPVLSLSLLLHLTSYVDHIYTIVVESEENPGVWYDDFDMWSNRQRTRGEGEPASSVPCHGSASASPVDSSFIHAALPVALLSPI